MQDSECQSTPDAKGKDKQDNNSFPRESTPSDATTSKNESCATDHDQNYQHLGHQQTWSHPHHLRYQWFGKHSGRHRSCPHTTKCFPVSITAITLQSLGLLEIAQALNKLARESHELQREIDKLQEEVTTLESRKPRRNFGLVL